MSVRPSSTAGIATMGDSFASGTDEAFRGFGGRHNALDQRGGDFYNWVEQENSEPNDLGPIAELGGRPQSTYLFPNGPTASYYPQSLFVSSRPYGFLLDRAEFTRFRLASDRPDAWQVSAAATGFDYHVAPGDPMRAAGALALLNGVHVPPPDFALRPQMDRSLQALADDSASYEAKVRKDLEDIDRHKVPLGVYRIEGWLGLSDETLRELIDAFHRRGIKVTAYFKAFISRGGTLFDEQEEFDDALAKGYLAATPGGAPFLFNGAFGADIAGLLDVTNPAAVAWFQKRIHRAFDLGFDGFQEDFGEQVQAQMVFANGETGQTMHNRYPVLFHKLCLEARQKYARTHPGHESFSFVRSGFSGTPGSSAYENATFPGDFQSTWDEQSNGLGASARDMLNRGIGGAVGYSTDIGGYLDATNPPPTKELLIRWAQWAALTPMFRLHNGAGSGARPPWVFDEETVAVYSRYARLHERAIPLIKVLWANARKTGVPITRPLWLTDPDDPEAVKQDQQWMFGPDLLVAPVVTQGARSRNVYFPKGCWQHPETGARHEGPRSVKVDVPLDALAYYARCGTRPFDVSDGRAADLGPRSCRSRRNFTIRLRRAPRGDRLVSARVFVNGKQVKVVRGRRLRARIDLRGLPRRTVTVRVTSRTARGKLLKSTRTYRTCRPMPRRGA